MGQGAFIKSLFAIPLLLSAEVYAAYSDTGSWSGVIDMPIIPVAVSNLPNGNVLTWAAKDRQGFGGVNGRTYTAVFDPYNGTSSEALVSYTNHDMFCPGINNLPDGRILVAGGSGNDKTSIYNPVTGAWQTGDPMNTVRGYQGNVTLTDGSILTLGGSWSDQAGNKNAERWTLESGWIPYPAIKSIDTVRDGAPDPKGEYRDDNHGWLWAAPNGKVFHAGPSRNMHWIDFAGNGTVTAAGPRGNDAYSMNGTTVMYDTGKILKTGGAQSYGGVPGEHLATKGSYIIDISTDNAAVTQVQDMIYGRSFHNSVVLPNGEVFVSGGMQYAVAFSDQAAVLAGEIWNPTTRTWKQTASMVKPRTYHSVSLLLNDGRVFVGGGGLCDFCEDPTINHPDVEIFSPPYLYIAGTDTLATRPVINYAPSTTAYNASISVTTNASINSFALVRANSATHSVNNEQRRVPVSFTRLSATSYQVNMPSRSLAPPGDYMLFAMNAAGTPSIAKTIRVGNAAVEPTITSGRYQLESPTSGQRLAAPSINNFQARMVLAGDWPDQQWDIEHLGGMLYTLKNVSTGRYLEVKESFCGDVGFKNITGSTVSTAKNQRWVITQSGGNYNLRPQHCKTKALDREKNLLDANAIVWDFTVNHLPQLWKLNTISTVTEPTGGDPVVIADGEYWLKSPEQGQNLTLPDWSSMIPRMVEAAEWPDQRWLIKHIGGGVHTLQNTRHQEYLAVTGSYCGEGLGGTSSSVTATSSNQQWRIYQNGSNYTLKPAHCLSKSLDREKGLIDADAIVWNSIENHTPQLWNIQSTGSVVEPNVVANGRYWVESPTFGQRLIAPSWYDQKARMLNAGEWLDQKWDITHVGNGEYTVKNAANSQYLQVVNSFCGTGLGAIDSTSSTATANNQKWLISKSGTSYSFRPVHCPSKGLDREKGLLNADAIVWDFIENHNPQLWNLVPAN